MKIDQEAKHLMKSFETYLNSCIENEVHNDFKTASDFVRDCLDCFLRDQWLDDEGETK